MPLTDALAAPHPCEGCGTEVAPGLLVCPACQRLTHASTLRQTAATARQAEQDGRLSDALSAWREALALLPPESLQSRTIGEKVVSLGRLVDQPLPPPAGASGSSSHGSTWAKGGGIAAATALLLWKLKFFVLLVLSKAKLLLSGLTKAGTLVSMVASLGVYWAAWGWTFALGLVGSIYVHEMGHVAALRRLGIPASAPMFVPGLGAFVRMRQLPASVSEEARVGLAGPLWGLAAAVATYAIFLATGSPFWAAVTQWGARINLFNLIPVRPLDGGRGFAALSRLQAGVLVAGVAGALFLSREGMLWLLLLVGGLRLFGRGATGSGDRRALATYLLLVAAFSALAVVPVSIPPAR